MLLNGSVFPAAKAEGGKQKAEGGRQKAGCRLHVPLSAFCLPLSAFVLLCLVLTTAAETPGRRPGPRPALWVDNDTLSIPEPARKFETLHYDFFYATFGQAPRSFVARSGGPQPAWNVNAWDEVPDSSWYTNRHHLRPMTAEQIARGANQHAGPDLSGRLVVLEGKTAGTSLGFGRTRDAAKNLYYIKFDSVEYPELTTSSEVICDRFFHALGFNVPQEWIIYVRPDQIDVDPEAMIWDKSGRERRMTRADVEEVLKGSARAPDGRCRAVASLRVPGNKGGFHFHGTRRDDPNDLIPHQHRRELRGLRLLSAWLNHYDIRPGNTMDVYVEEDGRKFLRHYLLDFGSTLGSASYFPKTARMGYSYVWDTREMGKPFLTLGIYQPNWREHPAGVKFPSVGRFESEMFSPPLWKPVLPLVAFDYMDNADAFWAARLVMSFTEEQIRAAVRQGQLSDRQAEDFIVRTLVERQRKIGMYGFSVTSPLNAFRIMKTGGEQVLAFDDLAQKHGFTDPAGTCYAHTFARLGEKSYLGRPRSFRGHSIPLGELMKWAEPVDDPKAVFTVAIVARRAEPGFAERWVKVYLGRESGEFKLLGWERD